MTTRLPVLPPFQVGEDLWINMLARGDPRIALNKKAFLRVCEDQDEAENALDMTPVYIALILQSYKGDKIHGISVVHDLLDKERKPTNEFRAVIFCGSQNIPEMLKGIETYAKQLGGISLELLNVEESQYTKYGFAKNKKGEFIKQLGGRRSHTRRRRRRVTRRTRRRF